MNRSQELWWRQARSDHDLFVALRRAGTHECHLLHYLQMATEKLSKAYFWRSGQAPPRSHTGFVRFLKALLDRRPSTEFSRIANSLGFKRREDFEAWAIGIQPLAYDLQNIAPAQAGNGPNPEYPWPHVAPAQCPSEYKFSLWEQLVDTGCGRKLIAFVERAIQQFEHFA